MRDGFTHLHIHFVFPHLAVPVMADSLMRDDADGSLSFFPQRFIRILRQARVPPVGSSPVCLLEFQASGTAPSSSCATSCDCHILRLETQPGRYQLGAPRHVRWQLTRLPRSPGLSGLLELLRPLPSGPPSLGNLLRPQLLDHLTPLLDLVLQFDDDVGLLQHCIQQV